MSRHLVLVDNPTGDLVSEEEWTRRQRDRETTVRKAGQANSREAMVEHMARARAYLDRADQVAERRDKQHTKKLNPNQHHTNGSSNS